MDAVTRSVLIVGGGVAGIACGGILVDAGFNVVLLEAADRIGGRLNTVEFGEGGHVELGAQWVHGEVDNSVFELVKDLDVLENDINSITFGRGATFVSEGGEILELNFEMNGVMDKLRVTAESAEEIRGNESLGEFASRRFWTLNKRNPVHNSKVVSAGLLYWIERFVNKSDGAGSWIETSARGQLEYKDCEGNGRISWKNPHSYTTLLEILMTGNVKSEAPKNSELPKWIHLKKKVQLINYGGQEDVVTVECEDGTKYTAQYVVTTVSLGVLKANHENLFHPSLSPEKVNAVQYLGFGVVDKIFLEFSSAWWPDSILGLSLVWDGCLETNDNCFPNDVSPAILGELDSNGIPRWCRSLLGFYTLKCQPKVLFTWTTGRPAEYMESLDLDVLEGDLIKVLRQFVGTDITVPKPRGIVRSTWRANGLTCGSYSFRTVETEANGAYAADLARPVLTSTGKPILCFAGEATDPHFFSTVHGAYDTGIREARRIISHATPMTQDC